jgi:ribokinase
MQPVVVVGSLNLDLVVGLDRMPDPGETVHARTLDRHPGGKGLNQAVAAARMGAATAMIGAVGDDDAGTWLTSLAAADGIDTSAIATATGPSGTAIIEVDAMGRNRIAVVPGANGTVTGAQVAASFARLVDPAVVLAQCELPPEAVRAALDAGRRLGAFTILNPAPATELDGETLACTDLLVPNEHEAKTLTGIDCSSPAGALDAARALLGRGVKAVIVTRGEDGALLLTADGLEHWVDAFRVQAVDTVAAGDAFCGALAASIARGLTVPDAMRWACAAGALAASAPGAVPSLPTRQQVEALLSR